jgi:lipid II:glycine glycyltransferase (peptidoglycan interpeptide bridge formation enzyme)
LWQGEYSMRALSANYSVAVDSVGEDDWHEIIKLFSDANIYQTWAYGEVRSGKQNLSHIILRKKDEIVAAALVRFVKIPFINAGMAYVFWGPLWKKKDVDSDSEIFAQILRALRNEYSGKRGWVLRLYPMIYNNDQSKCISILKDEGFELCSGKDISRTMIINLSNKKEELRKGLAQKWRNSLNKAEKNNIELIEGTDDQLFEIFIGIYKDMLERKKFIEPNDINEFRRIQKKLPEELKMKIMLCRYEGELSAGSIFSALGDMGLYLFGATNDAGMKSNGSYLMQWKYIEWLKEHNYTLYDLNGINPEKNPGTYKFKEGLCGKNGQDVYLIGQYQVCDKATSRVLVSIGEKVRVKIKDMKIPFRV